MKTTINLKLNLKNLFGVLENGNSYRVFFEKQFIKSQNKFQLHVIVKEEELTNVWMYNEELSIISWYNEGGYKMALRDSLIELEDKLNVELLKSTMSIAV